jgi:hypothetical protein
VAAARAPGGCDGGGDGACSSGGDAVMEWAAAAAVTTRPCPCCIPRRAVAPRRGTQWIPHSHVQSTQPCGATHRRTVEHDQHWQRSLRRMRKALQNDEPKIGLCEPRLRFLHAEAMQAMQAAAMLRSAPQKPTMITYEDHHSIHRLSCHHLSTATIRGSPKENDHPIEAVFVTFEQPGQDLTRRHHDVM